MSSARGPASFEGFTTAFCDRTRGEFERKSAMERMLDIDSKRAAPQLLNVLHQENAACESQRPIQTGRLRIDIARELSILGNRGELPAQALQDAIALTKSLLLGIKRNWDRGEFEETAHYLFRLGDATAVSILLDGLSPKNGSEWAISTLEEFLTRHVELITGSDLLRIMDLGSTVMQKELIDPEQAATWMRPISCSKLRALAERELERRTGSSEQGTPRITSN